jgi:hypothetical protein
MTIYDDLEKMLMEIFVAYSKKYRSIWPRKSRKNQEIFFNILDIWYDNITRDFPNTKM